MSGEDGKKSVSVANVVSEPASNSISPAAGTLQEQSKVGDNVAPAAGASAMAASFVPGTLNPSKEGFYKASIPDGHASSAMFPSVVGTMPYFVPDSMQIPGPMPVPMHLPDGDHQQQGPPQNMVLFTPQQFAPPMSGGMQQHQQPPLPHLDKQHYQPHAQYQHQQRRNQRQGVTRRQRQRGNLYKTELCRKFQSQGRCRYGDKCQFAHGKEELRGILRHPLYKTSKCVTFHTKGSCPYGTRCRFIHDENESDLSEVTRGGEGVNDKFPTNKLAKRPIESVTVDENGNVIDENGNVVASPADMPPSTGEVQLHGGPMPPVVPIPPADTFQQTGAFGNYPVYSQASMAAANNALGTAGWVQNSHTLAGGVHQAGLAGLSGIYDYNQTGYATMAAGGAHYAATMAAPVQHVNRDAGHSASLQAPPLVAAKSAPASVSGSETDATAPTWNVGNRDRAASSNSTILTGDASSLKGTPELAAFSNSPALSRSTSSPAADTKLSQSRHFQIFKGMSDLKLETSGGVNGDKGEGGEEEEE